MKNTLSYDTLKMKSKAQIYGIVLVFLIAAIVLALIFIFGFKGISDISEKKCQSELVLVEKGMKSDFDLASTQTGSISRREYNLPCSIDKVYLIDLEEGIDEDIANESKLINDSYTSGVQKNVFFMKKDKILHSIYLPELKLKYPYYRCFETAKNEKISFYLEGNDGETDVEHADHRFNCGYIPVLMEDEGKNDWVLRGMDIENADKNGNGINDRIEATEAILGKAFTFFGYTVIDEDEAKKRVEDTKENVFIGRKVDIKKDGTKVKIRVKLNEGKSAEHFTYVESIPKECIMNIYDYFLGGFDDSEAQRIRGASHRIFADPLIVWHFDNIEGGSKKEEEYTLDQQVDCLRIINALGFGEIS